MEFTIPNSKWIWIPDGAEGMQKEPCLARFRKEVELETVPSSVIIHISADSRYKLYVNGILAELGPSKGDRQVWFYDEVELGTFLKPGVNVLAVEVLRYPLLHRKGNHGIFRTEIPGLYIEETGPREEQIGLMADASWKCSLEESFRIISESMFFAPLQILEDRTGNPADAGWKYPGFDDSGWQEAQCYNEFQVARAVSPGNLQKRTIPYMRKEKRHFTEVVTAPATTLGQEAWEKLLGGKEALTIPPHSREIVEISAGEEMTGYLSLKLAGGAGSELEILCSEGYVRKPKEVPSNKIQVLPEKGDRSDWKNGILNGYTDTYHVAGYGRVADEAVLAAGYDRQANGLALTAAGDALLENYEPFWFRTFRYVRLTVQTGDEPLTVAGFDYLETGYPLEAKAWVETSDETLAPVWDISLRTLRRCMHETYEDCPFYEQLQYAMDSRNQILYTYMVSADDRLARKCMDDFRRSQRYDGMINCSYPCYGPNVIPGFSIYYVMMLYDHMMFFGDKDFLRQHMSAMDGIFEYFNRNLDERGLVGKTGGLNGRSAYWSFIDWTKEWDETTGMPRAGLSGPITMESLLYVMGLTHGAEILTYLGRKETAAEYLARAEQVRAAVNRYCTDENGMYLDGPGVREYSQHCQVFALLTDTVSVEKGRTFLQKTLEHPQDYAQCSVAMAYYLFRAMEKAGMYEETKAQWDVWRDMVKNNLTTCVEDGVNGRSDCHAWGSLALYELPAVVLGVRPGAPGFEKIEISPVPGYFTWAKGQAATKWGMVYVEWTKDSDGTPKITYKAPEGVPVIVGG